jgi:hypothetical protein
MIFEQGVVIDFVRGTVETADTKADTETPRDIVIHGKNGDKDTVTGINPRPGESLRDLLKRLHPDLSAEHLEREVQQVLKYNGDYGNSINDGALDAEITSIVSPDGKQRTDLVYSSRGRLASYNVFGMDGQLVESAELNQSGDWIVTKDGKSQTVKSVVADRFGTITITDADGSKLAHLTSGTDVYTRYEDGKPQESTAMRDGKEITRFEYEYKDGGFAVFAIYPDNPGEKIVVTRAENREQLERLALARGFGETPAGTPGRSVDYDLVPEDIVVRNIVDSAYGLQDHSVKEFDSSVATNLGCARMVSEALLRSGMDAGVITTNVDVLEAKLKSRGWVMVPESQLQAGDVIIATGPRADQGHTGIFVGDGQVMHNSSSMGRFTSASYSGVFSNFQRRVGYRLIK